MQSVICKAGDGVSEDELEKVMRDLGQNPTSTEIDELMDEIEENKDGMKNTTPYCIFKKQFS